MNDNSPPLRVDQRETFQTVVGLISDALSDPDTAPATSRNPSLPPNPMLTEAALSLSSERHSRDLDPSALATWLKDHHLSVILQAAGKLACSPHSLCQQAAAGLVELLAHCHCPDTRLTMRRLSLAYRPQLEYS